MLFLGATRCSAAVWLSACLGSPTSQLLAGVKAILFKGKCECC